MYALTEEPCWPASLGAERELRLAHVTNQESAAMVKTATLRREPPSCFSARVT